MYISKQRPQKFEHPVGLVFYARLITEAEKNESYEAPSREHFEMLCSYEPMMYNGSYENYLAQNKQAYDLRMENLRACKHMIEKCAIERARWDEQLTQLEQKSEFDGYLHYGKKVLS